MILIKTLFFFFLLSEWIAVLYGENMKSRLKLLHVACAWCWNELWQHWSTPAPWSVGPNNFHVADNNQTNNACAVASVRWPAI